MQLTRLEEWSFPNVQYFSVRAEGADVSLFHDFMDRIGRKANMAQEYDRVLNWIEYIGYDVQLPLRDGFFRHEGRISDVKALPPEARKIKDERRRAQRQGRQEDASWMEPGQLRLYCHPVGDHVVFLFNGDVKTKGVADARDCPVVRPHFDLANRLARRINRAFDEDDIRWVDDYHDIDFSPNLTLDL